MRSIEWWHCPWRGVPPDHSKLPYFLDFEPPFIASQQMNLGWSVEVEFNAALDTVKVISEAVFTANHLTDTDKGEPTTTQLQPFNGLFSRTTWVSQYQKGKTNLDFAGARDSEWQWHQLSHMQVCTSLQTDNHASTPPLCFFTGRMPFLPPNQQRQSTEGTKHWRWQRWTYGLQIWYIDLT